jgi:hypothetical protein
VTWKKNERWSVEYKSSVWRGGNAVIRLTWQAEFFSVKPLMHFCYFIREIFIGPWKKRPGSSIAEFSITSDHLMSSTIFSTAKKIDHSFNLFSLKSWVAVAVRSRVTFKLSRLLQQVGDFPGKEGVNQELPILRMRQLCFCV